MFFVFYPCMLCGMIPVNLLGYDERSRWMQYSGTMPYTKTQIVSGKYLIGLLAQLAMLIATGAAQAAKMMTVGIMESVRVSLTIVAKSPAVSENAYPAATTLEVSLTAVPAHKPYAISLNPIARPKIGNRTIIAISNRKVADIA